MRRGFQSPSSLPPSHRHTHTQCVEVDEDDEVSNAKQLQLIAWKLKLYYSPHVNSVAFHALQMPFEANQKVPDRDDIDSDLFVDCHTNHESTTNNYPTIHTKLMFISKAIYAISWDENEFGISSKNLKIADDNVECFMNFSMKNRNLLRRTRHSFVDRHSVRHIAFKKTYRNVLGSTSTTSIINSNFVSIFFIKWKREQNKWKIWIRLFIVCVKRWYLFNRRWYSDNVYQKLALFQCHRRSSTAFLLEF